MKVQLHKEKLLWQSAMTVIIQRGQKMKDIFFVLCLAVISTFFSPLDWLQGAPGWNHFFFASPQNKKNDYGFSITPEQNSTFPGKRFHTVQPKLWASLF